MAIPPIDELVRQAASGDRGAIDRVYALLLPDVREIVLKLLKQKPKNVHATDIISRIYERLIKQRDPKWNNRAHFLRFTVLLARRAIWDALKSDHRREITLPSTCPGPRGAGVTFPDFDACLRKLEGKGRIGARTAEVLLLRCLTDLKWAEIAQALDVCERTAKGDWAFGQAYLRTCLGPDP